MDTSGEPKRILVTGAAGFIGFHLSRILQQGKNDLVIAVDNFNDYYDVRLKMVRFCHCTCIEHQIHCSQNLLEITKLSSLCLICFFFVG